MIDTNFQTPPHICRLMVDMIPLNSVNILEPTPGVGNLRDEINSRNKYMLTSPDDYFLLDPNKRFDCVVMNPPFSEKYAFNVPSNLLGSGMRLGYHILSECMDKSDNIIALMPWFTISDSDVRLRKLVDFGMKSVTALPRKTFQYARIQTCIIELERGFIGDTLFKTLR